MSKIWEKLSMVATVWGLMQVAYHIFVTHNVGLELVWIFLTALYAIMWGLNDDS